MEQSMVTPVSTSLVRLSEFGPFHAIVFHAHDLYLEGFFDRAVLACREGMLVTVSAGDRVTTQFLRYVEGITLQEGGRHHEAVTVALDLLADVEDDPDPMWRAKALALLAESSTQVGEVSRAMDALAEGAWLVAHTEPGRYNHLSASNAVAVALRAVFLFEQADELLAGIKLGDDIDVDLQVVQERALLAAFWGTTLLVFGHDREAGPHLVTTAELDAGQQLVCLLKEEHCAQGHRDRVACGKMVVAARLRVRNEPRSLGQRIHRPADLSNLGRRLRKQGQCLGPPHRVWVVLHIGEKVQGHGHCLVVPPPLLQGDPLDVAQELTGDSVTGAHGHEHPLPARENGSIKETL